MSNAHLPIHQRPGYNQKNFPGANDQHPALSAEQWASTGPGYQQQYEGVDHDRNSVVATNIFHGEGPGTLGDLEPHQVMSGHGFDIDPRTIQKVDPAAQPPGAFSRGIHPNWDPANTASREASPPPTGAWEEPDLGSSQGEGVIRVPGHGSVHMGVAPGGYSTADSDMHSPRDRGPLSKDQFGG